MKKSKFLIVLILLCGVPILLPAQSKKAVKAIDSFLATDFMQEFQGLKNKIESHAMDFKSNQHLYQPAQINRFSHAYQQIVFAFNEKLGKVKTDMQDRKTQKYFRSHPKKYEQMMKLDLYELQNSYSDNFLQVMNEIRVENGQEPKAGSAIAALIFQLAQMIPSTVNHVKRLRLDNLRIKEQYLNRRFQPYQLNSWDRLGAGGMLNQGNSDPYNEMNGYQNGMDTNMDMNGMNFNGMNGMGNEFGTSNPIDDLILGTKKADEEPEYNEENNNEENLNNDDFIYGNSIIEEESFKPKSNPDKKKLETTKASKLLIKRKTEEQD